MGGLMRDMRHAVKGLARKPLFTALAGLTLAIGIGANTAIFSVVDSVLLNPLPYPESDRLLSVNLTAPGLNLPVIPYSEGMYLLYEEEARTFERMAVYNRDNVNLMVGGEPERVPNARVTEGFFDVLGVRPALGRAFQPGEDRLGAEPLAVLGNGLWRRSFGGDPSVIGRVVEMDGVRRRIVGVMPAGFEFPEGTEMWTPVDIDPANADAGSLSIQRRVTEPPPGTCPLISIITSWPGRPPVPGAVAPPAMSSRTDRAPLGTHRPSASVSPAGSAGTSVLSARRIWRYSVGDSHRQCRSTSARGGGPARMIRSMSSSAPGGSGSAGSNTAPRAMASTLSKRRDSARAIIAGRPPCMCPASTSAVPG